MSSKSTKAFIGLDLSLNHSGAVLLDENKTILDMFCFTEHDEDCDNIVLKMCTIRDKVVEFINEAKDELFKELIICTERPLFRSKFSTNITQLSGVYYVTLTGIYHSLAYTPELIELSAPTIKKAATGNGHADKNELFAKAPTKVKEFSRKIGDVKHMDVTDAYWIAYTGIGKHQAKNV